jgi:hypothetical protein
MKEEYSTQEGGEKVQQNSHNYLRETSTLSLLPANVNIIIPFTSSRSSSRNHAHANAFNIGISAHITGSMLI